ncbi:DDE-type integrase/transposase/recombinase, partial [Fructilactobacillus sanfranciscensis]|uniref:DDE-type integrase/transposase/recombinase n=1 Tax=Fructilactobacillus sanfranciscensis TaxID=1625 RepID=UPI0031F9DF8D
GYSFSKKMNTDLVLKTLESAIKNRTITGDLIIHTDLGSQYTSDDYNQRLTELHIRHSYSRKGCPYDNAPMESFHASLKKECVYPVPVFENYETAAAVVFEYVHSFSTIGREFIVHLATRHPYKLKFQKLRAKWPPDLMLSRVQISY